MSGALTGPLVLAVPSALVFIAAVGWDAWARPALPPRFRGYAVRQGWQVDPLALLDSELRKDKISTAIAAVRDRVVRELVQHHKLTVRAIGRAGSPFLSAKNEPVAEACRAVRQLDLAYRLAARAEDPRRTDLWSRWRRPVWRARARYRFEQQLGHLPSFWPALEGAG